MRRILFLILSFTPVGLSAAPVVPVLTSDTGLATAGYYQLSWQPGAAGVSNKHFLFELQQSTDVQFESARTIYRGPDRASVISGQKDGEYFYRVRIIEPGRAASAWSEYLGVEVRHHSRQKAWLFFVAGAAVFFVTLAFIVTNARCEES